MDRPRIGTGLLAKLALSLASLTAVIGTGLGAEWVVRAFNPRYLDRFGASDMACLHVYSKEYGWAPRAGFRLRIGGWPETTINRAGYRGREYPHARTPGKHRVLMLGDSLAFGYGVGDDETSSRQMERLEPTLEVINLAVQGYGTDQAPGQYADRKARPNLPSRAGQCLATIPSPDRQGPLRLSRPPVVAAGEP